MRQETGKTLALLLTWTIAFAARAGHAADPAVDHGRFTGCEAVVKETHRASMEVRERVLRETIAKERYWIKGVWGETLWCLSALYLNEKTDIANTQLLVRAEAYCAAMKEQADNTFKPEKTAATSPWGYFAFTDYVRIMHLFHAQSPHFPGRLKPETEAAMKEALWWRVKSDSKVADASLDNLLVTLGTENHDLTRRPQYYLAAALLKDDPAFRDRRYDDGHTAAEHFDAYNAFFQEWPRQRIRSGLWFEVGSSTYQKYSWPALFNLHELSPDPIVRRRFGMLLDVAFVEEAQISVHGRRGGGRSRAHYGNAFESYKNLLYAPEGKPAGSSHSKVIETSRYQLPAEAILLRKMAFPAKRPFIIANRVLGELEPVTSAHHDGHDDHRPHAADSALINYAYRTPHYLLGSTLQNPALSMPSPETGEPTLKYAGISRQNRWSGMLFQEPDADHEICAVYPVIERTRGGRPQHPHWSFQHENVLFLQRIAERSGMGSYSTGRISIRFHGEALEKVEEDGWIFAAKGQAFAAVRFLDGVYEWDETGEIAGPVDHDRQATTRILIHAGDVDTYPSFKAFRNKIRFNSLTVEKDRIVYRPAPAGPKLECFRYDVNNHEQFQLPLIDGRAINLRPEWTHHSPFLRGRFGEDSVAVRVGPIRKTYDFRSSTVTAGTQDNEHVEELEVKQAPYEGEQDE